MIERDDLDLLLAVLGCMANRGDWVSADAVRGRLPRDGDAPPAATVVGRRLSRLVDRELLEKQPGYGGGSWAYRPYDDVFDVLLR